MNLKQSFVIFIIISVVFSGCAFVGPESNGISLNLDFASRYGEDETYHIAVMIVDEDDPDFLVFEQIKNLEVDFDIFFHFSGAESLIYRFQQYDWETSSYNLLFEVSNLYFPYTNRSLTNVQTSDFQQTITVNGIVPGRKKRALVMLHKEHTQYSSGYWSFYASGDPGFLGYGVRPTLQNIQDYGNYGLFYDLFISDVFSLSQNGIVEIDFVSANPIQLYINYTFS